MPETGQARPRAAMRNNVMEALGELASGRLAERMRLDMAARVLVVVHRVLTLRGVGLFGLPTPRPAQRRAVQEVERIAARWEPRAMTAREFVADLRPAEVRLLVDLAPAWALAAAG